MSTTVKSSSTLLRGAAITAATALVAGSALLVGGTASAATILVPQGQAFPAEVSDPADPAYNYDEWHQGYATAPADAQTVEADGLHISGISQILKGYDAARLAGSFSEVIDGASVSKTGDDVFLQIPLFNEPGTRTGYTTLYPTVAGSLDTWTTTSAIVGDDATNYPAGTATLTVAQLDAALGDFDVLGAGVLTTAGTAAVVSSFSLFGDTYQFALPAVPLDAKVTIVPSTISQADAANADKGFTVTGTDFAANTPITLSFRAPDGTEFGFSSADGPIVTDALGAFTVENVYFTISSGVLPAGVYVVVVTDGTTTREANISVIDPNAPAVVTPAAPTPKSLAATGLDDSPLFLTSGLGLLLAGIAAFGITVVARRRTAE
ncbi:hypothetical protein ASE64_03130 [Agreia sp. Leaf210]|nr:hypothetical protein ASE64_03130 [Agreia sp. Leaf210]